MPLRNVANIKKLFSEAKERRESVEKEEKQRNLNRELNAKHRRENIQASEKLIDEVRSKALIAAGEGCYQLLIPKLKRYERQRLSSLGFSTRTLGDEQDFLEGHYTKIYGKSLVDHYSHEAESFFDWLAYELGL